VAVYDDEKQKTDSDYDSDFLASHGIEGFAPDELDTMEREAHNGAAEDIEDEAGFDDEQSGANEGGGSSGKTDRSKKDKSASSKDIGEAEKGSLFNPKGDKPKRFAKTRGKFSSAKKKAALIGGAIAGFGMFAILIYLVFFLGSLVIPNFTAHVTSYEFAKVTRDYSRNVNQITEENITQRSATKALYDSMKQRYGTLRDNTWGKLDKYRPEKVIANLDGNGDFKITTGEPTAWGTTPITGVSVGGTAYDLERPSGILGNLKNKVPGVKLKNNISFASKVAPELTTALKASDIGPIVRGRVAKQIRQKLGIGLISWQLGKYIGKTPEEARVIQTQEAYNAIDKQDNPNKLKSANLEKSAQDTQDEIKKAVNDPVTAAEISRTGELPADVQTKLNGIAQATRGGAVEDVIGFINPIYKIALPLCLIYDGSIQNGDATAQNIDTQTGEEQRTAILVNAAGDQLKPGSGASAGTVGQQNPGALATAAGAMSAKMGDISASDVETRASGSPVDTSSSVPAEASALGQFTIADAVLPSPFSDIMNSLGSTCPAITNIWLGGAIGLVNLAAAIPGTVDGTTEAEVGASAGIGAVVGKIASNLAEKFATKDGLKATIGKLGTSGKQLTIDTTKFAVGVAGATFIAKVIVMSQAGAVHSGISTNKAFTNDASSGNNILASEQERQGLYGRPMASGEVAQGDQQDSNQVAAAIRSESAYQRYLAVTNPDSLLSHIAMSINIHSLGLTKLGSWLSTNMSNPLNLFSTIASPFTNPAYAASTQQHYGNLQSGWPPSEVALIKSRDDYKTSLENEKILEDSGQKDTIDSYYGVCFSKDTTLGTLLTKYVDRDSSGNAVDGTKRCDPNQIGPNNSTTGANADPSNPCGGSGCGDLVFRYRIAGGYNNTYDQLDGEQNPTAQETDATASASNTTPAGGGTSAVISGDWAWPVSTTGVGVSSCYGARHGASGGDFHPGTDIYAPINSPVYAAQAGTVSIVGPVQGYGNNFVAIVVSGTPGQADAVVESYGHMNGAMVKVGDKVTTGQQIGIVGDQPGPPYSFGAHLHLNLRIGAGDIYNGNASIFNHGLKIPAGVPDPYDCQNFHYPGAP
jgi:hypothetical protein